MFSATVGGSVGMYRATAPLVTLTADEDHLGIEMPFYSVRFAAEDVVKIETCRPFPFLMQYVRIHHNKAEVAKRVVFGSLRGAAYLIAGIKESGFVPAGKDDLR